MHIWTWPTHSSLLFLCCRTAYLPSWLKKITIPNITSISEILISFRATETHFHTFWLNGRSRTSEVYRVFMSCKAFLYELQGILFYFCVWFRLPTWTTWAQFLQGLFILANSYNSWNGNYTSLQGREAPLLYVPTNMALLSRISSRCTPVALCSSFAAF